MNPPIFEFGFIIFVLGTTIWRFDHRSLENLSRDHLQLKLGGQAPTEAIEMAPHQDLEVKEYRHEGFMSTGQVPSARCGLTILSLPVIWVVILFFGSALFVPQVSAVDEVVSWGRESNPFHFLF